VKQIQKLSEHVRFFFFFLFLLLFSFVSFCFLDIVFPFPFMSLAKKAKNKVPLQGILVMQEDEPLRVLEPEEFSKRIGKTQHQLQFSIEKVVQISRVPSLLSQLNQLPGSSTASAESLILDRLTNELQKWLSEVVPIHRRDATITIRSLEIKLKVTHHPLTEVFLITSWSYTVIGLPFSFFFFLK
jgi:hypothetical protein